MVLVEYFPPTTAAAGYRGHPQTSLCVVVDTDLRLIGMQLKSSADLTGLRELTRGQNGRLRWHELTTDKCVVAQAV